MPSRQIHNGVDLQAAIVWLETFPRPSTMTLVKGVDKSLAQNNTQHLWIAQAVEQLCDETREEKRAYCKLNFGIPILRHDSIEYRAAYDECLLPNTYEWKLKMMAVPHDYPVTRGMTTNQMSLYLDAMYQYFRRDCGVDLIDPDRTWP